LASQRVYGLQDTHATGLKLDSPDAHEICARLVAEKPNVAKKGKNLVACQKELLTREELYNALG